MLKKLTKENRGFTIIEVLIVLAIAGLILLIVFLAVPALQRNSRNTQVRNSAAAVLAGINEYVSNNNGQAPPSITSDANGNVTIGTGTNAVTAKIQAGHTVSAYSNAAVMPTATGQIAIRRDFKCNAGGTDWGTGTSRAFAAGYLVEGGSNNPSQCVES